MLRADALFALVGRASAAPGKQPAIEVVRIVDDDLGAGFVVDRAFATEPVFLKRARRQPHVFGGLRRAQDATAGIHTPPH